MRQKAPRDAALFGIEKPSVFAGSRETLRMLEFSEILGGALTDGTISSTAVHTYG